MDLMNTPITSYNLAEWILLSYLVVGFLFSLFFVISFAGIFDIHAKEGTIGFRIMILPATFIMWPLVAAVFCGKLIRRRQQNLRAQQKLVSVPDMPEPVSRPRPLPKPRKSKTK